MIEDKELAQLFKTESAEHLAKLDDGLLRLEKKPTDQPLLEEVFRESHSLKGAARMLGLSAIEAAAHDLETTLNMTRKGETALTPDVIERMTGTLGELRGLVREALGGEPVSGLMPSPQAAEPFRIETVRVETRKLDELLTLAGELSVIAGRLQHRLPLMDDLLEQWAAMERDHKKGVADRGLRIAESGKKLKEARDAFYEDGARLETTANTLEEQVHAARLLPLSTVFSLFPRMVRDLAKAQGKEVELLIEGGETGVDKSIIEEMKDPLMHLLRNAIDHGIEAQPEREQQGKPRGGTVRLRAVRENSTVLLEVRDDGRGLDMDAIRQMALKRGLHDEAALAAMTPAQLQQLIFLPGFSTSTCVTELSGRGVGLDVVRVNVERLKGDIRLESSPQHGTAMQVRLPLSIATTRLLLADVGERLYGLPVEFVHSSRRVRDEDVFTLEGRPAISLDGQPVIAPRLADLLRLPRPYPLPPQPSPALRAREGANSPQTGEMVGSLLRLRGRAGVGAAAPAEPAKEGANQTVCIVLQVGDELLGLRVDELLGEEEVVAKPLGAPLVRVRNVSGLTILGSGEICAVLNPADLVRTAHQMSMEPGLRDAGLEAHPQPATRIPHPILLVEDSALVRAMEQRILEDAGYEVTAAVDGMDALDALGRSTFAAVVSDIVMPNMDGLTLTTRIRQEPRYQDLPVILVTTLSSDEDKRRGLEAGANAYIPKPSFDQRTLLETLQRLVGG